MATGASEKLAQEGLRGNRDRLAEGKRVGSGVREVSHDLERMRGAGSLLHLYQTDRWVRMVNTKLTHRSVWYELFNNAAEDRALFLLPQLEQGQKESQVMYCSTNGNHVEVREDDGRIVRRFPPFRGPVESAYMSGNDKVVITYTDVQNNLSPHPRYTELYSTDGRMIRRTRC